MYKRCINDKVDGLTLNKIYDISEVNIKVGEDGIIRYCILDDYNVTTAYKADRFIDVEKYYFKLWHCLDLNKDIAEQTKNIINPLDCYCDNLKVDDEGLLTADILLFDIKELKELSYSLDDDVVIYGSDCDYIMTKKTMKELGLD